MSNKCISLTFWHIFQDNNYDQDKCIDAALELYEKVSSERRKSIETRNSSMKLLVDLLDRVDVNSEESKSPLNSPDYYHKPSMQNTPTGELVKESKSSRSKKKLKARGNAWTLPETFLRAPRYRFYITSDTDFSMNFSVIYRRTSNDDKIGLTIGNVEWESVVCSLHSRGPYDPLPAKDSGVEVGDVLIGIDHEFFSPVAEVQDIIDILNLSWMKRNNFVTLHFMRLKQYIPYFDQNSSSFSVSEKNNCMNAYTPTHAGIPFLLEQGVITKRQVRYIDTSLLRLKERAINWDLRTVADRIEKWNLDPHWKGPEGNALLKIASSMWERRLNAGSTSPTSNSRSNSGGPGLENDIAAQKRNLKLFKGSALRPALSVRIVRAEELTDFVVYVLWVRDIRTGVEWTQRRRFREFFELREVRFIHCCCLVYLPEIGELVIFRSKT